MNSERANDTPPHARITSPTSYGLGANFFHHQSTIIVAHKLMYNFLLRPPRSTYKTQFFGTRLGEVLRIMLSAKSVPKGLKLTECERCIGGKHSPIRYIPKKDLVQEALEKSKKVNYFKLTLPHRGSEFKVALWASGTPEQFVLHVRFAIHACKQIKHDVKISKAKEAVANATLDLEICMRSRRKFSVQKKNQKGIQKKAYLPPLNP